MNTQHIACIVGARPNFMKVAPILKAARSFSNLHPVLIHTGQHYDSKLSDVFFEQLDIPRPDVHLEVGSGSHGVQTARVLERMEEVLQAGVEGGGQYSRVLVVGDVNSTLAATLAAVKLHIPVAHVEAGLRSRDRSMPEEINRLMTDAVADLLLVSEPDGVANLLQEGHPESEIHLVGNVMIDTLLAHLPAAKATDTVSSLDLTPEDYAVVTLHRPSNVDDAGVLGKLVDVLLEVSDKLPIAFPVHPRTQGRLQEYGLLSRLDQADGVRILPPLGYHEFLAVTSQSRVIVTDSGGLQEESTALGIPCLTMRENTERPITVTEGTSTLIGNDADLLRKHLNEVLSGDYKHGRCPSLWDGKASERIAKILAGSE